MILSSIKLLLRLNELGDIFLDYILALLHWRNYETCFQLLFVLHGVFSYPLISACLGITLLITWPLVLVHIFCLPKFSTFAAGQTLKDISLQPAKTLNKVYYIGDSITNYWNPQEGRYIYSFIPFQCYSLAFVVALAIFRPAELLAAVLILCFLWNTPIGISKLPFLMELHYIMQNIVAIAHISNPLRSIDSLKYVNKQEILWDVEIWENQRWWVGVGWTSDLLQNDPGPWSDRQMKCSRANCEPYFLLEPCIVEPWRPFEWEYSLSFKDSFPSQTDEHSAVRYRKWTCRFLIKVGDFPSYQIFEVLKALQVL